MTTTEADRAKLEKGYEMWSRADPASVGYWLDIIADDVDWRSLADGAVGMEFSRGRSGKQEVIGYFEELGANWMLENFEVKEIISQGDRHVVLCDCAWKHQATGKVVETPKVDVFRMKDGLITEFCEYYDTAKSIAATT